MRAHLPPSSKLRFLKAAGIAVLVAAPLAAQEEPRLKVDVGLVNVAFSARTADGRYVEGLKRDDFEVFEDGVRQTVGFFSNRSDLPLTIGLIEDASGSQEKFIRQHARDTREFLTSVLHDEDRAFVVGFGDHVRLVSDLTLSPDEIELKLKEYDRHPGRFPILGPDVKRHGGTALFDATFYASRLKLKTLAGRKALLVFSDGEDNSSEMGLGTAIEAAEGADALVYAIRYTEIKHGKLTAVNRAGIAAMQRLADETGGREFDAAAAPVKQVFAEIGEELRSLYELAYRPVDERRDGRFRRIEIRCKRADVRVRARLGYFGQ